MIKFLGTLLFAMFFILVGAQEVIVGSNSNNISDNGFLLYATQKVDKTIKGNSMLFNEYMDAGVQLVDGDSIESVEVNYDIFHDQFSVMIKDGVLYVDGDQVESITTKDASTGYIQYSRLQDEDGKSSIYKILIDGDIPLALGYMSKVKKPNYNPVLETGRKDYRKVIYSNYYLIKDGISQKLPKKKKQLLTSNDWSQNQIKVISDSKYKYKNEKKLKSLFTKLNDNSAQ